MASVNARGQAFREKVTAFYNAAEVVIAEADAISHLGGTDFLDGDGAGNGDIEEFFPDISNQDFYNALGSITQVYNLLNNQTVSEGDHKGVLAKMLP